MWYLHAVESSGCLSTKVTVVIGVVASLLVVTMLVIVILLVFYVWKIRRMSNKITPGGQAHRLIKYSLDNSAFYPFGVDK